MRRAILGFVASILLLAQASPLAGEDLESQVKAAFLFNFLKFVEWPVGPSESPWVIGVIGRDPFAQVLERTVKGKSVNGRPVEVRRFTRLADVKDCHILFIGRSQFERFGGIVQPGLLTVGESPEFLKSGGVINFYLDDNRVHIEIRPAVARAAGLHVSAQLLKLGRTM